jgi:manganese/zinc/iron transport system substrate-binding protein
MKKFLLYSIVALLAACGNISQKPTGKPQIVCTTGMLGDAVKALTGSFAEVHALMGPGVDPHVYKASQGDVQKLTGASVIVYNGLHLEGKMGEIFHKLEGQKPVIAAAEALSKAQRINATEYAGAADPHVWFNVALWSEVVQNLANELSAVYPEQEAVIMEQNAQYQTQLKNLHRYCQETIGSIPPEQRVLITAHDAFKYFGEAYAIEVRGLQGISTTAEYGLQDVSELVNFITERKIKAIFIESSVSPKSIEAVIEGCRARGHEVQIGGELFSDAMGKAGTEKGTYIGMVRHNVETISKALK